MRSGAGRLAAVVRLRRARLTGCAPARFGGGLRTPLLGGLALAALLLGVLALDFATDSRQADALTAPAATARYLSLDAGDEHNCALRANRTIRCWGGDGDSAQVDDAPEGRFRAVSAGIVHSCAIREGSGAVVCWGADTNAPDGAFRDVSVGWHYACGVRDDGRLECWGTSNFTKARRSSVSDDGQTSPPEGEFTAVSAGYLHACGLRESGEVACWGRGSFGRTDAPAGIFTQVSAGTTHSCALRESGAVGAGG